VSHTLSYNNIGRYGRLGNQMFQYAAVLGIAEKTGHTPIANIEASDLFCFELGGATQGVELESVIYNEPNFSFDERVFDFPSDRNIDLIGYYQTEKYFSHIENDVRDNFTFKEEVRHKAGDVLPEGVLVSIHVRRTDYIQLADTHKNQGEDYYREAMENFKDYRPVVFSDDIGWCKENMKWLGDDAVFMDNDQHTDLCVMSWCNGHIIANSSFSWWGSYLGCSTTVAPKNWFGPKGPQDWSDIYREGWILV